MLCNAFLFQRLSFLYPVGLINLFMFIGLPQGALLLTEVMKERDAQIEIKKGKQNWEKEREEYLYQLEQRVIVVFAYQLQYVRIYSVSKKIVLRLIRCTVEK